MKNITHIIFLFIGSSALALFADDSPFAKLMAARKQIELDESIYRNACYKAYSNGNNPPIRVLSSAELDEKKWYERCIQLLRKTHTKEILEVRTQYASAAVVLGMCMWGIPCGFITALLADSMSQLQQCAFFMLKGMSYLGIIGGGIAFITCDSNAEKSVLEKELVKLDPTTSKD